jgi:hypothetical protein
LKLPPSANAGIVAPRRPPALRRARPPRLRPATARQNNAQAPRLVYVLLGLHHQGVVDANLQARGRRGRGRNCGARPIACRGARAMAPDTKGAPAAPTSPYSFSTTAIFLPCWPARVWRAARAHALVRQAARADGAQRRRAAGRVPIYSHRTSAFPRRERQPWSSGCARCDLRSAICTFQDVIDEGRLSGAQEPRHDRDRDAVALGALHRVTCDV